VAARVPASEDPAGALAAMRTADLYLACACARGDPAAVLVFDARFGPAIRAALGRMRLHTGVTDEALQVLRTRLFVGDGEVASKIADYSGRGDLASWARAVALRIALRLTRRPKGEVVADTTLAALPTPGGDLELEFLKKTYAAEFDVAVREAFAALEVRERLLLREYFGHGLTVNEIGDLHRVGKSTAARWVSAAREALVQGTRDQLMKRLSVGKPEVASILRLIESQLASKVADLVRPPPEGDD
jgi:RNA polymerase sigma-70 factor (ECF subfamily)